ncbi:MAG: hypothetical protein NTU61_05850 [Candidatus Altiarchaeota archaeon]|nr:hypothetical protein [Candidatus Altiarchaeota archaeon]
MDNPLDQSKLTEYGFPRQEDRVRRNPRPIKSLCTSCGSEEWLNWISSDKYVCDKCAGEGKGRR